MDWLTAEMKSQLVKWSQRICCSNNFDVFYCLMSFRVFYFVFMFILWGYLPSLWFSSFDLVPWFLQYWIAALVFSALTGSSPWCSVLSYASCHVYRSFSSAESWAFVLACNSYNVSLLPARDWLWLMLCDIILLWDRLPLSPSLQAPLAHCILLFCESLLLSLENVCWSILLSQRSVEIKIKSETLVLLSRENGILWFRLNPQSLPFLWYIVQSNLMLLPCFWENDLMGKAVFYKKRTGHGDCIFSPPCPPEISVLGSNVWKQHIYFCMNY